MEKKGVVVAAAILAVITVMSGAIAAVLMGLRVYPSPNMSSPAMFLGVVAAGLALTTQILASTAIGCCRVWRRVPSQTRRVLAILLFVASWVLSIKVVLLFLVGSMLGLGDYKRNTVENRNCIARGVGIFMAAIIILFLIVVCLDIASYILIQKGPLDSPKTVRLDKAPSGIAMGSSGAVKC